MAVTTESSDQVSQVETNGSDLVKNSDWNAKGQYFFFTFTQGAANGDAGSIVRAIRIPPGRWRMILSECRIYFEAMGTARTMDIGWLAYTDVNGDTVVADPNGLDDGIDVSSAGSVVPAGTIGTHETKVFDARSTDGVTITLQINDGTLPIGKDISGYFVLAKA